MPLEKVSFQAVSIITTTGYATTDYTTWGYFMSFIFFISFSGGSAGSTSGGRNCQNYYHNKKWFIRI